MQKKDIIIVDIDGTISKIGERLKYIQQKPKDWDSFYNDCFDDEPIPEMVQLVRYLCRYYIVIFCTGRRESVRQITEQWIDKHVFRNCHVKIPNEQLIMRPDNDKRQDMEVKPEQLFKSGIDKNNIAFVLEDRDSMVQKWRELGLICLQVANGDY